MVTSRIQCRCSHSIATEGHVELRRFSYLTTKREKFDEGDFSGCAVPQLLCGRPSGGERCRMCGRGAPRGLRGSAGSGGRCATGRSMSLGGARGRASLHLSSLYRTKEPECFHRWGSG